MNIDIAVSKQNLSIVNGDELSFVEGSQQFITFTFALDEQWRDLDIFAQFSQNGKAYNVYLDEENKVDLPPEIKAGTCMLVLYGTGEESIIGTTNFLVLKFDKNMLIRNAQSTEVTQPLYNQLVKKFKQMVEEGVILRGLPPGGTTGQALIKDSDVDFAAHWGDIDDGDDPVSVAIVPETVFGDIGQDPTVADIKNAFGGQDNCDLIEDAIVNGTPIVVKHPISIDNNPFIEMCPVVSANLYDDYGYFCVEMSCYSKHDGVVYHIKPEILRTPYSLSVKSNYSVDGIFTVENYTELPNDVTNGRIAFVETSPVVIPYGTALSRLTVDEIRPVEEPDYSNITLNRTLTVGTSASDQVRVSVKNIDFDGTELKSFIYEVIRNRQTVLKYAYVAPLSGESNGSWNKYDSDSDEYISIDYANIIAASVSMGNVSANDNTGLADKLIFKKLYPVGYYSYNGAEHKWEYGFAGLPLTQLRGAIDANGVSIIHGGYIVLPPIVNDFQRDGESLKNNGIASLNSSQMNNIFEEYCDAENGLIYLNKDRKLYKFNTSSEHTNTVTINTGTLTTPQNNYITFELMVEPTADPVSVTFDFPIAWLNDEAPSIQDYSHVYLLAFRSFDGGQSWIGNLQGSWEKLYSVTFDLNGGIGIAPDKAWSKTGAEITLPETVEATKEGFEFAGWATFTDPTTILELYTIPEGGSTLYAVWNEVSA